VTDLKVTKITRVTAGFNPIFRVEFSDGFIMRSNEETNYINTNYYNLMYNAIDTYEYGKPIGRTSHEDFYDY